MTRLGLAVCLLAWWVPAQASPRDSVQWRVPVGIAGGASLVVDATHVYIAIADGNGSVVVEDLKRPVIAASDDGVAIATQGNIAHIPGYAGAVLWLDARARTTKLVYPQAASSVAVAGDRIYAIVGADLVALARP